MENNEQNNAQNLGSQEQKNPVKQSNAKLIGIVVTILVILAIFFIFFTRSAKSTVKKYVEAIEDGKASKIISLIDFEGITAFGQIDTYSSDEPDFKEFDENYNEEIDRIKDLSNDEKDDYKELKEKFEETLQEGFDERKEENEKIKYTVKDIKTEKVNDSKKLRKVTCTITVKTDDEEEEIEDVTFYTMKKGFKHYIVSPGL